MSATSAAMAGGVDGVAPYGQSQAIYFAGTWVAATVPYDKWGTLISAANGEAQIGNQILLGLVPSYCKTVANRVYMTAGTILYFSDNGDPTGWDIQNPGAGYIDMSVRQSFPETLTALATYQGRLAVFAPNNIQLWSYAGDPAAFAFNQNFENVGTPYKYSVQSLGDLDVMFLHYSGIKSLRVRDSSLNGNIVGLGDPIDSMVRIDVAANPTVVTSIVNPVDARYWLYLNSKMYVFSYYPTIKITAWSTYTPTYLNVQSLFAGSYDASGNYTQTVGAGITYYWIKGASDTSLTSASCTLTTSGYFTTTAYDGTHGVLVKGTKNVTITYGLSVVTTFVPNWFTQMLSNIYALDETTHAIYKYSGTDTSIATVELPWLDAKRPAMKTWKRLEAVATGTWTFWISTDPTSTAYDLVGTITNSTMDIGSVSLRSRGTHIKIKATSESPTAVLGGLYLHYDEESK